ncbi:hypothetical protein BDZ45DRAFT_307288 [Acephala macrosclerotiorum]|nr:hypothetical protein BDZ45DRAFT_307288 [Acephala macrosclerotiorum]
MSGKYPPVTPSTRVGPTPKSDEKEKRSAFDLPTPIYPNSGAGREVDARNPRDFRMEMLPYRQRVGLGPMPLDSRMLTPPIRALEDGTNDARLKGIETTLTAMRKTLDRIEERISLEPEDIPAVVEEATSKSSTNQKAILGAIKRLEDRLGCIENFQRSVLFSVYVQDQADLECMTHLSKKFSSVVKMMEKLEREAAATGSDEDLAQGDGEIGKEGLEFFS